MSWFYHPWPADEGAAVEPLPRPTDVELATESAQRRQTSRRSFYRLAPPTLVGAGIVFAPISRHLAPVDQNVSAARARWTTTRLAPPVVVTPAPVPISLGPTVRLADLASPLGRTRRHTTTLLRPPFIAAAARATVAVHLAPARRPRVISHLYPPAATTTPFVATPVRVRLAAALAPRQAKSRYVYPTVINGQPQAFGGTLISLAPFDRIRTRTVSFRGEPVTEQRVELARPVKVTLTQPRRPRSLSLLFPPADIVDRDDVGRVRVTLAPSPRQARSTTAFLRRPTDTVGLEDQGSVSVTLVRARPRPTTKRLRPPAVVGPILARPTLVALAPSSRGVPHSRLIPPAVVGPILARPITVTLAPQARGVARSHLAAPTVVAPVLARAIVVSFAPQSRGATAHRLSPPAVVAPVLAQPIRVRLARIRPVPVAHRLAAPAVVTEAQPTDATVDVTLAYQSRRPGRARLAPPVVIDLTPQTKFVAVHLTYSRRGTPKSFLLPPTDLVDQQDIGELKITLAPSRRGTPRSHLAAPVVVNLAFEIYGPTVRLARIRPVPTQHTLGKPTDTVGLEDQGRVTVHLAPSPKQPRATRSHLFPPADTVGLEDAGTVTVTLARIRPERTITRLAPPTVVFPFFARPVDVTLAYSLRGKPKSTLRAPVVIDLRPQVYYLTVTLARNEPQPTVALLRPPVVTRPANPPVDDTVLVKLVRIRPVPTRSVVRKPVVVQPFLARPVLVELAPQRRGRPLSVLAAPVVVRLAVLHPIRVTLAPSRFPRPLSHLSPPTVVGRAPFAPITVTLAPQSRRPGTARLKPPTVVARAQAGTVRVTLAPSRRGRPLSRLLPPAVVGIPPHAPVTVVLARNRPQPTTTRLAPPTVIDLTPQVYRVQIHLAPSSRGVPISLKVEPSTLIYIPPAGEVCGDDSATDNTVEGGTSSPTDICTDATTETSASGASASPSTIRGADSAGGSVSGTDGKAT